MAVDDHELSWGDFEGVIGEGYGAGQVIVWDRGSYRNLRDEPLKEGLDQGHISFWLEGELRLLRRFALPVGGLAIRRLLGLARLADCVGR